MTRWDGVTLKPHPVTGEMVPDETARVPVMRLIRPKAAPWPSADFIIGNPPFIAGKDLRAELGDGYTTALWACYKKVPRSADIAMFFWLKAAQALVAPKAETRRFGFITSNSIRQTFCRRVIADAMAARKPLDLVFAIPDHPWSDGAGAAAVRIAMTVAERTRRKGEAQGVLQTVLAERPGKDGVPEVDLAIATGPINADLSIGADLDLTKPLRANEGISSPGVKLHGAGFIVSPAQAKGLGLGHVAGLERHIRPYLNGRDLTQRSRGMMVIDLDGLAESEVRARFPATYQHVLVHVKPERDHNNEPYRRLNWWLFGRNNSLLRGALRGLSRYIATVETAKHRVFCFLPAAVLPDNKLVCIATEDAFHLGVLSSRFHVAWALAAGGRLGVGNDPVYVKTRCFDPFPFPAATAGQRATIEAIAEELDAHRRTRLDAHPHLTMTGLYNVLDKLRAGRALTPAERDIHDAGQLSLLLRLHDDLDAAVAEAYGWPVSLPATEIVARLVALNLARQAEEAEGEVRWLRPDYQAPNEQKRAAQTALSIEDAAAADLPAWPSRDPERYVALRGLLATAPGKPAELSRRFRGATPARLRDMLETLVALGQARLGPDGRYQA
ncbi:type IIL restriction-modification enzyme MmeI [Acidisoma sp. 7E03]